MAGADPERAPVLLHAAGSLRAGLSDVAQAFEAATGVVVTPVFGASGLLRGRIEAGEAAEVFASADFGNPDALARAGRSGPVVLFARNELCAFLRPGLLATAESLLARMLDGEIKLGTSTPKADPSGDYAFAVFRRAEAVKPGARAVLEAKALQLTGGPNSQRGPEGCNLYGHILASGQADIFLTYRTNAIALAKEQPGVSMVRLSPALAVGAEYGLTVLNEASPNACRFAMFILSRTGQEILAKHGFAAPLLPREGAN
ncbi:molybdate ABC transporter substrate-binding protein [Bosea caraganae]|uniref:Molybdate ABC transporter substrate-binding protein n=1 Tax=Bosea caraganae TaxID=2763117 RepID=A0A370L0C9_9HYPH|nr:molybdate ABC transporter substrate-binding protein [Bosea caraganae]RDJ20675.1 molybdate ABC transporter substrate-binding protein [Bosea caraganae]RDJ28952.1 molybdate ABC transporter substrate-binding protein [Bosea caraganae]